MAIIRQTSVPTKHAIRRISADSQIFNIFHPVHIKVALVAILRFAVTACASITAPRCFIHLLMASLREGAEACCWCRWHRSVFLGFRARVAPQSAEVTPAITLSTSTEVHVFFRWNNSIVCFSAVGRASADPPSHHPTLSGISQNKMGQLIRLGKVQGKPTLRNVRIKEQSRRCTVELP